MLSKHLALTLLGTSLLAAPALAQTSPATSPSPNANMSTQPMSSGNWMTQEQQGQWRASKLEGLDVYNNNDEKVGDISELILDNSGKIQAVVIGVGGFLGIGERDVAVPFDQIKFVNEPRANTAAANTGTAGSGAAGPGAPMGTAGSTAATGAAGAPANPNAPAGSTMATNNANTVNTTGAVTTANRDNMNRSAPDHAMLNMTKDQLRSAPEFKYAR